MGVLLFDMPVVFLMLFESLFHPKKETCFQNKTNSSPLHRILHFPLEHLRDAPWAPTESSPMGDVRENHWQGIAGFLQRKRKTRETLRKRRSYFRQWEWITENMPEAELRGRGTGCGCAWHWPTIFLFLLYFFCWHMPYLKWHRFHSLSLRMIV